MANSLLALPVEPVVDELNPLYGFPINELPDECLIQIIKRIPLKHMDDVSQVSKRWNRLVQDNIKVEVWASDVGFRIGYRFFDYLKDLKNFTIGSFKSRIMTEDFPAMKSPDALNDLEFATPTTEKTFRILTNHANNLQELHFGYGSLTQEDISGVQLDLPNLKVLIINDRAFECKEMDGEGPETLAKNILGFLGKGFPSLKELTLSTVSTRRISEQYGIQLLKFLEKHYRTISKLHVLLCTTIERRTVEDYGSLDHSIVIQDAFDWELLSQIRFEDIVIDFGSRFFVGMNEWEKILRTQDKLKHINFSVGKPLPLEVSWPAMSLSSPNLVTVQLGLDLYRGADNLATPIDCSVFEACSGLKMLILTGNSMNQSRPMVTEITNVTKLPKSLQAIGLEHIFVLTSDSEFLFMELPELKKIALEFVGTKDEYGVTLNVLNTFLKTRQILEIIIKGFHGNDSEIEEFDNLAELGLTTPLDKATLHITFYNYHQKYIRAM